MDTINQLDIEESRETLESKFSIILIVFTVLYEMSQILNCNLTRESLSVLVAMIEKGSNPEALIRVVKEMRDENTRILNASSNQLKSTK